MSEFSGLSFIRVYTHVLYTHLIAFKLHETRCDTKKGREISMKLLYHLIRIEEERTILMFTCTAKRKQNMTPLNCSATTIGTITFEVESIITAKKFIFIILTSFEIRY